MHKIKKTTRVLVATAILQTLLQTGCSEAPDSYMVEGLIQMQYEQATGLMTSTVDTVESNEVMMAMKGLMTGTMAKLENVNNADCDSTDEDNTYHCTVDITQSVNSNSKTSKATFKVYQVNDEWVLGV